MAVRIGKPCRCVYDFLRLRCLLSGTLLKPLSHFCDERQEIPEKILIFFAFFSALSTREGGTLIVPLPRQGSKNE